MKICQSIECGYSGPTVDVCRLTYDARIMRRKRLKGEGGIDFLVDLEQVTSMDEGDAFDLGEGQFVRVEAANEPLLEVRGTSLNRLAWHIGNRHTPCQIENDCLRIAEDHVLEHMLLQLGAEVGHVNAPFRPEGGAYGHGRTFGHSHGHDHDHVSHHSHG